METIRIPRCISFFYDVKFAAKACEAKPESRLKEFLHNKLLFKGGDIVGSDGKRLHISNACYDIEKYEDGIYEIVKNNASEIALLKTELPISSYPKYEDYFPKHETYFFAKVDCRYGNLAVLFNLATNKVFINPDLIDLPEADFAVYFGASDAPILCKSDKYTALIMPINLEIKEVKTIEKAIAV